MPEGPEIRRAADRVAAAIVGRAAEEVFFAFPALNPGGRELAGQRVTAVESRGKAMLTWFSSGWGVYSHNQLYGRWYVRRRGSLPRTGRSLRFAVHTATHSALLYSASDITVLHRRGQHRHPYLSRLGPDPLETGTTAETLVDQLLDPRFDGRALGGLLLDQGFVAGLGNYLRSEILFTAGLHPGLRPADCTLEELARLAHAALDVTRQSYETGGITSDLDRARALAGQGVRRAVYRHAVFARAGRPCPACGARVEKHVVAGRRLYLCPQCQPRG